MAEFIALPQTLAVGDSVAFAGCTKRCANVMHKDGSGTFVLRGGTCCNPARYSVHMHIVTNSATPAPVQVQLYVDGDPVPQTLIGLPAVTAGTPVSGDVSYEVETFCDCTRLSARALTAVPLTAANIIITRTA